MSPDTSRKRGRATCVLFSDVAFALTHWLLWISNILSCNASVSSTFNRLILICKFSISYLILFHKCGIVCKLINFAAESHLVAVIVDMLRWHSAEWNGLNFFSMKFYVAYHPWDPAAYGPKEFYFCFFIRTRGLQCFAHGVKCIYLFIYLFIHSSVCKGSPKPETSEINSE